MSRVYAKTGIEFDSERRFFACVLKTNRQLPDSILPPRRMSFKDIHDGALKESLGIVYADVDVLRGMSLRTLFETAWTIAPTSFLGSTFGIANNDKDDRAKEERSEGGGGISCTTQHHDNQKNATWARHLFCSFL